MRPSVLAVLLVSAAACGRGDHARGDVVAGSNVTVDTAAARAAADEPLGPGDVRVTSTDGAVILALVGDSVRLQLSDSLRNKVKQDLDSSKDGFAGMITRSVSGVVSSAMGFVVRVPVRDIEDVRYEDGQIKLRSRGGKGNFSMGGDNDGKGHASFSQADGERFVAAVKARQAQLR
jgi:hypothetical protein